MNNHTDEQLESFGVELEALQIDDSRPAVNFKVIASPNNWQKSFVGQRGDEPLDDRRMYFYQFNEAVANELQKIGVFQHPATPTSRYEQNIQRSHSGILYMTIFSRSTLRAVVSITFGQVAINQRIFDLLREKKGDIERDMRCALNWDFEPGRRRQIISVDRSGINREDETEIQPLARWAAETLSRLKSVLEPLLGPIVSTATRDEEAELRQVITDNDGE